MTASQFAPIFELLRGDTRESLHYGAAAVVEAGGKLLAWFGDPHTIAYLRSAAKPLQLLPFLESGGQAYFNLTSREIAVMCASHSGSDEHVAVVRSIQEKANFQENDLLCGVHPISHRPTLEAMCMRGEPLSPNRNNCSGKHSGMLAFARMRGLPIANYIDPAHPIQQDILRVFAEMCDWPAETIETGIDGCSAPNFAVPLYHAALAIARLSDPIAGGVHPSQRAEACRTICSAMIAHPDMVGGAENFDTRLMKAVAGRLICKGGAEGYLVMGLLPGARGNGSPALGIAIKISDGDLGGHSRPPDEPYGRIRPSVALEILRQLGATTEEELAALSEYGPGFPLHNWRRLTVGLGRPCFTLHWAE